MRKRKALPRKKPVRKARAAASPKKPAASRTPRRVPPPEEHRADEDARPPLVEPRADVPDLTIVGVGASAGGLEAFSQLLRDLPPKPDVALVLVQHLAPQHESALPELLAAQTSLPVVQATEGMRVERNRVHVIPPNVQMGIGLDGVLYLLPRPTDGSQYRPIDYFLTSLAECLQDRAIAVILSGTASDGTNGVREVKAVGGVAFAQDPATAKYDGMPRTAIATGLVDLVLPPAQIAAELVRIGRDDARASAQEPYTGAEMRARGWALERIFVILRSVSGVDFRRYKVPTIERRLRRRMVLHRIDRIQEYQKLLEARPEEVQALYQDLLIHVTHFFRESGTFETLRADLIPKLLQARSDEEPIRAWVAGCASGEEAYSLAIVLLECLGDRAETVPVQIFATDLSEGAIERAREGMYAKAIEADVSPERLRRFFVRTDGGYRVTKAARELCVFARQDITRDPPFSRLDLVFCRNVLIYFGADLQKRLMGVFHYALKPNGYLVLGRAETIGQHLDLFRLVDNRNRIYQKKQITSAATIALPATYSVFPKGEMHRPVLAGGDGGRRLQNEASRLVEDKYAPPGVIVDGDCRIVQFRGQTGPYLAPASGEPTMNLLKLAREGLLHGLRSALQEVRRVERPVRRGGLRVKSNGGWCKVALEVLPLATGDTPHFLILFQDDVASRGDVRRPEPLRGRRKGTKDTGTIARLQQEIESSREYLQSIIQELEAANEELQSANEEILSSNEELQSTNEELDTAKEELQSTNEEINTVNEELQARNDELSRVNADFVNLLGSVQIAIVIVASDLRIRRFTPMAERVLNLIPSDVGRPISHIKPNIDLPDLEALIVDVVDTMTPQEREVRDQQGNWYSLRVRPYKSLDNRIEGAVLALFDMSPIKKQEQELRRSRDLAQTIVETVRQPLLLLDANHRVRMMNRAFRETFGLHAPNSDGRSVYELGDGAWNTPALRASLDAILGGKAERSVAEHDFPSVGRKKIAFTGRRIPAGNDGEPLILLAIEDVEDVTDEEARRRPPSTS